MDKEVIITTAGYEKLMEEYKFLTTKRRKEVAERIKEAISFGDISENSEYEDAKNEQAFVEGRIQQVNDILSKAQVIDTSKSKADKVNLGSWVLLRDLEDDSTIEYQLVGSAEADPGARRISNESPVGQAILGKRPGATVKVRAPQGEFGYEIMQVSMTPGTDAAELGVLP